MKITWLGHACFAISAGDYRIIVDPYEENYVPGCVLGEQEADAVYCSHFHGDHGNKDGIKLRKNTKSPFTVTEIKSFHDNKKGALRGENIIRIFEADGIKAAHFGDIGCELTAKEKEMLSGLDVALVPIGGTYTLDCKEASKLIDEIKPRVTIPMHYKSERFGFDVLKTVEEFVKLRDDVVRVRSSCVEITEDAPQGCIVLEY